MTSRERVLATLNFRTPDRLPKDLGGMRSTGISAFAYPKLVQALGLPPRRPKLYDTSQMLAMPELDVLDALGCDVVTVDMAPSTNALDEPAAWRPYDFNGRLPALMHRPEDFRVESDGTILQGEGPWLSRMPADAFVFDTEHAGEPLNLEGEIARPDLGKLKAELAKGMITDAQVQATATYLRRIRAATGRAIFFNGIGATLGFPGGMAAYSMLCLTEPELVHELHDLRMAAAVENLRRLLPAIAESVDVVMLAADDHGIQTSTILPPAVFRELYVPYYRRANAAVHECAPGVKSFLHCCGAVYDILDDIIAAGFDVLNPVQWSAGGHSWREWKDKCRGRIALWGGGVNTQTTLPHGTPAEVAREAREVAAYLAGDNGYVFCAIHNLLAEVPPEKILALYGAAAL
ncbi:MAG: uroporphyrinogen decarboxylase family protein [Lentisphaeria bacterium]|jgi:uroporphyrinogen decarboxylase